MYALTSYIGDSTIKMKEPTQVVADKYKDINAKVLQGLLNFGEPENFKVLKSNDLFILKFKTENRLSRNLKEIGIESVTDSIRKLKPVNAPDNSFHLVRKILFECEVRGLRRLNWSCLISVENGDVLNLDAPISGVTGLVFEHDPVTQGGSVGTGDNDITLNPFRTPVILSNLNDYSGNDQQLRGSQIIILNPEIQEDENNPVSFDPPTIPPVEPPGINFDYDVRTTQFAAVNAYYNMDRFLSLIVDLGVSLNADPSNPNTPFQFPNTVFPLSADHYAHDQIGIFTVGDFAENRALGIQFSLGNIQQPFLGIATSYRITLHEFSHILLFDYIGGPSFWFAHSFGDGLAAILNDPTSAAPDRFMTLPWLATEYSNAERRHDRLISDGYAWHGSKDNGSYDSEEILSTTLFRAYRSLGGDSERLDRRVFGSRIMTLLLLKSVRRITPLMNPEEAEDFADLLIESDIDSSFLPNELDGVVLGGAHKVMRWAFEKQGAYQDEENYGNSEGLPPQIDIFIDDTRGGEYPFLEIFWNTTDIINRTQPDGFENHQTPILGVTNFVYVTIRNRGLLPATNINVKGYHCIPSGGMVWPADWQSMQTTEINVQDDLNPGNTLYIGPFSWIPTNQGHECLMMTVKADGDVPNTENISNTPTFFLVPHDNNIGMRNVAPVPGFTGGGIEFIQAFKIYQFTVKNPFRKKIIVNLRVELPEFLKKNGWSLEFPNTGSSLSLDKYDRRGILVKLKIISGQSFSRQDIINSHERDIVAYMDSGDDGVIGGMTYRIDPDLKEYKER